MERPIFGHIKEAATRVRKPVGVAVLTFAIATGGGSTPLFITQAENSNSTISSEMQSGKGILVSHNKTLETLKNVECTTKPVFPYQPEVNNSGVQIAFAGTNTVPCMEIGYSDGSREIIVSPFLAYAHPLKAPDGTYLFPALCELPGIAEPIYGPEPIPFTQDLSGVSSYCVYPPVEKGESVELIPLAQPPAQTGRQISRA